MSDVLRDVRSALGLEPTSLLVRADATGMFYVFITGYGDLMLLLNDRVVKRQENEEVSRTTILSGHIPLVKGDLLSVSGTVTRYSILKVNRDE